MLFKEQCKTIMKKHTFYSLNTNIWNTFSTSHQNMYSLFYNKT